MTRDKKIVWHVAAVSLIAATLGCSEINLSVNKSAGQEPLAVTTVMLATDIASILKASETSGSLSPQEVLDMPLSALTAAVLSGMKEQAADLKLQRFIPPPTAAVAARLGAMAGSAQTLGELLAARHSSLASLAALSEPQIAELLAAATTIDGHKLGLVDCENLGYGADGLTISGALAAFACLIPNVFSPVACGVAATLFTVVGVAVSGVDLQSCHRNIDGSPAISPAAIGRVQDNSGAASPYNGSWPDGVTRNSQVL